MLAQLLLRQLARLEIGILRFTVIIPVSIFILVAERLPRRPARSRSVQGSKKIVSIQTHHDKVT